MPFDRVLLASWYHPILFAREDRCPPHSPDQCLLNLTTHPTVNEYHLMQMAYQKNHDNIIIKINKLNAIKNLHTVC